MEIVKLCFIKDTDTVLMFNELYVHVYNIYNCLFYYLVFGKIDTNYNNGVSNSNSWNSLSPCIGWSQEVRKYQDQPEFVRYNQVRMNTQGVGIKVFLCCIVPKVSVHYRKLWSWNTKEICIFKLEIFKEWLWLIIHSLNIFL